MKPTPENFYVALSLKDGRIAGHAISSSPDKFDFSSSEQEEDARQKESAETSEPKSFEEVFSNLVERMGTYMQFIPIVLFVAPQVAETVAFDRLSSFSSANGKLLENFSTPNLNVYELESKHISRINEIHRLVAISSGGLQLLPEILVNGLISSYDAFLSSLLRVVIDARPEIVMTSQKQITFKELLDYESIEAAKEALIDREVETVIRKSHHEQFDWMQGSLSVKLKEGLPVWPDFVELCERRNLFTHTGGIVSGQYLKVCKANRVDLNHTEIGQRLSANPKYYERAVEIIQEVGMKLCYVLWRKFKQEDVENADSAYNGRCVELIKLRAYGLAEALLSFSRTVPNVSDRINKMMVVNLANAIALQGRNVEANKILDSVDWSAASNDFQLCVKSVKKDVDGVIEVMSEVGQSITPQDYRRWPVFRQFRSDAKFQAKFEEMFGEPLLIADASPSDPKNTGDDA